MDLGQVVTSLVLQAGVIFGSKRVEPFLPRGGKRGFNVRKPVSLDDHCSLLHLFGVVRFYDVDHVVASGSHETLLPFDRGAFAGDLRGYDRGLFFEGIRKDPRREFGHYDVGRHDSPPS